jgi:hypothetical protein
LNISQIKGNKQMKKTTPLQEVSKVNNIYALDSSGDCTCYDRQRKGGSYYHNGRRVCKHEYYTEFRSLESKLLIATPSDNGVLNLRKKLLIQNEVVNELQSENEALKSRIRAFENHVQLLQHCLNPNLRGG